MYFTQAPESIAALKPRNHSGHPGVSVLCVQTKTLADRALELADKSLVQLVSKIPYNAWGGAINMNLTTLIEGIGSASYETIIAVCGELLTQPKIYRKDTLDRHIS